MLDDGCDDRRRAESGTNAGEPIVCLDEDQRRIALALGSKVGAVTLSSGTGADIGIAETLTIFMTPSSLAVDRISYRGSA
jgi:hypothetical protein